MALILILAALLDYFIGDPRWCLHPVQIMGWGITSLTQGGLKLARQSWQRYGVGLVIAGVVILGSGGLGWSLIKQISQLNIALGQGFEVILLASCFAGRSLRQATLEVIEPLQTGNLALARQTLAQYVGRDTQLLDEAGILRALLETVAENAIDGVMAPLFFAFLGAWLPLIGPAPLALSYKAASTLDSMIGYRRSPYREIGCFSAKLEDGLTWLPCRLSVVTLGLIAGVPGRVWGLCWRDARQDPSPNSGWSECVYAAILHVQLGGTNYYQGVATEKPLLGDRDQPIHRQTLSRALQLTRWCFLSWLIVGSSLLWIQATGPLW